MSKANDNLRAKKAVGLILNGVPQRTALRESGYSETYAKTPSLFRGTQAYKELVERYLPEDQVLQTHSQLLSARRLEHMIFPTFVTDEEIDELITSVGCVLRKVMHSEQANHAYFWAPDNKAREGAIQESNKLKGRYAPIRFTPITDPYEGMTVDEMLEKRKEVERKLKERNKAMKEAEYDNNKNSGKQSTHRADDAGALAGGTS